MPSRSLAEQIEQLTPLRRHLLAVMSPEYSRFYRGPVALWTLDPDRGWRFVQPFPTVEAGEQESARLSLATGHQTWLGANPPAVPAPAVTHGSYLTFTSAVIR